MLSGPLRTSAFSTRACKHDQGLQPFGLPFAQRAHYTPLLVPRLVALTPFARFASLFVLLESLLLHARFIVVFSGFMALGAWLAMTLVCTPDRLRPHSR